MTPKAEVKVKQAAKGKVVSVPFIQILLMRWVYFELCLSNSHVFAKYSLYYSHQPLIT